MPFARTLDGLLERSGLDPEKVEDVINGTVTQVGEQGANIGRLGVLLAGFPVTVPAVSLNRMCGSSQQAVHFASQAIAAGDIGYAIASGAESMTRAPMFSDTGNGASGFEEPGSPGETRPRSPGRERRTYRPEVADIARGPRRLRHREPPAGGRGGPRRENKEILPTTGLDADDNEIELTTDEGIRHNIDPEKMASLKTVFRPEGEGVVTAGNSSQLTDGASAVLVGDRERAEADGFTPRARFLARVAIGEDPVMQLTGVIPATRLVLKKAGLGMDDLDWIEINEAFASVVLSWADELAPDMEKVNPWGGAIAHGQFGRHRRRTHGEDARRTRSHRRPVRPPGHVHRPRHVHRNDR